jgi:hypothetical protein
MTVLAPPPRKLTKEEKRLARETRNVKREENLKGLATLLIARHIAISVPDKDVRDRLAEAQPSGTYDAALVEREMHCIAVVGAGASSPLLQRGDELAKSLEKDFGRDKAELDRLKLVNNLKRKALETRLIALSRTPEGAKRVRDTISEKYNVSHPTLLGYELLAHLLKHRFLDAIISFNFDELLDQSLDDELEQSEYIKVVSERDCNGLMADPSAPEYVPLYIKLHGTASEPESLRFTPDSYYSIPEKVSKVVEDLLHTDHCVIANIGSGLASFDFQRLLRIPQTLDVYNLSRTRVKARVSEKIDRERGVKKTQRNAAKQNPRDEHYGWLHECNAKQLKCNRLMHELTNALAEAAESSRLSASGKTGAAGQLVKFRSVGRHKAVAKLLGADAMHARWADTPGWVETDLLEYVRRRTILELAFAGAKASGLLSLVPLANDRPARYYELYRRRALNSKSAENWTELCSAAGLIESEEVPDILLSHKSLRKPTAAGDRAPGLVGQPPSKSETRLLHEFDPEKLARHVLMRVKNDDDEAVFEASVASLKRTLDDLQGDTEIELHMRDDRVCSKAFRSPATLPTSTSLQAYTWLMLSRLKPKDEVHVSAETGDWLLREPMQTMLLRQEKIRLLLAFDIKSKLLYETFGEPRLELTMIDPWRHNRHMRIVCEGDQPKSAIYFARRQRTPVITAVYLDDMRDVKRLTDMYTERWDEAKIEQQNERDRAKKEAKENPSLVFNGTPPEP